MSSQGLTPAEHAVRETALAEVRRMAIQYKARKWTQATGAEYVLAITAAAGDDIEAVQEGVHAAITATEGNFPPTPADTARAVARAHRRHLEDARRAENRRRRDRWPTRDQHAHCGYLAYAAVLAGLADRGDPAPIPERLQPYVDLVTELGYRNHHGCGEFRDVDGHLHPADPNHDPELYAQAEAGAREVWEAQGRPTAPNPARLVAA